MHANDLFETVTDQLIADIETGAAGTWRMPWHTLADAGTPTSVDGRPYRGMNALWLAMVAAARGWTSGVWGTYRAWQRHGAQVRRGEKATQVVLWKPTTPRAPTTTPTRRRHDRTRRPRLLARAYAVFAAEQVDGADEIIARRAERLAERDTPERIAAAERTSPPSAPPWSRAATAPTTGPPPTPSTCPPSPSSTPPPTTTPPSPTRPSTGPATPTASPATSPAGSATDSYAAEELVAELGAAMWCAQAGISAVTRPDHAAYLAGWLRVLRTDARALVTVASRAQAAVDHLNTLAGHHTTTTDDAEARRWPREPPALPPQRRDRRLHLPRRPLLPAVPSKR